MAIDINKFMPKISVILPTYKPKIYIETCLESIAQQSFKDFELLIILNAYRDPYYEYVGSILTKYNLRDKTKLIYTKNPGVSNARNIGLDIARGEFITFIDDDDVISSVYLDELLKCSNIDCVGISNIKSLIVFDGKEIIKENPYTNSFLKLYNEGFSKIYNFYRLLNGPWGKLYHQGIIKSSRFCKEIPLGEDALFNFTISKNYKTMYATSPNAVYYYRQCDNNSWSQRSSLQFILIFIKLFSKYVSTYFSSPTKYNLILFLNRVLAILKTFSKNIVNFSR
ncbi:MAG: glycosyltransferase family 2 protein [Muribaculum sp.]|nr:glycosyltransferase family 2 protein [Muribaculum sp.]